MQIDRFSYEKMDYELYKKRLEEIEKNPYLQALGMQKRLLGTTSYKYGLYEYTIGNGTKDLFIIGGTHGSEIITVDFVTQLLLHLDELKDFDPNLITLHIIPNINPEGFDLTTSTLHVIDEDNLEQESHDYYLRYRTDNVINSFLNLFNNKLQEVASQRIITPEIFLNTLKDSFKEKEWLNLCANNAIPNMVLFQDYINKLINYDDFAKLMIELRNGIEYLISTNKSDPFFVSALNRFQLAINSKEFWQSIIDNDPSINKNIGNRLYQERFENAGISAANPELSRTVSQTYKEKNIPEGSQVKFDPNGRFINLNQNTPYNPGIIKRKSGILTFGPSPSNNIVNYEDGPIGKPTEDDDNFTFAVENAILNSLFAESIENHRFMGALLYHGTGGVVYSKPYQTEENKKLTDRIATYNDALSEAYREKTGYRQIERADNTGYGDLLRQTYPGILLIELSKMGGNPIAPYGDLNNLTSVMNDNISAINNLIVKLNELIEKEETIEPNKIIR